MKKAFLIDEYIGKVQSRIRWKRARKIAAKELEDHIDDKVEELVSEGSDYNTAVSKALAYMGDPLKIGKELDAVYSPKINVLLLEVTAILLITGAVIGYLSDNTLKPNGIISVIIGVISAVALYFFDYTVLMRHPLKVYMGHLIITFLLLLYDARNGLGMILYSYTFYSLIFFPITLCIIGFYSGKRQRRGEYIFTLCAFLPTVIAVLISSLPAFIIILTSYAVIAVYGIKKKWFRATPIWGIYNLCLILISITASFSMSRVYGMREFAANTENSFVRQIINNSIDSADISYGGDLTVSGTTEQLLRESYPFVVIVNKYGYFITAIIIILFIILLSIMLCTAFRQKTEAGRITAFLCFFVIAFQFICSLICNFTYMGSMSLCIPFILDGGLFTIADLLLIGIVMSVSRHEPIAKEWMMYKEKESVYV